VFPYTRGIHPTGYRGKLWTMRQFAGFGTPEETNERYKNSSRRAAPVLSVAFDLPTLMGRDPDHELSLGEVGKCGVSIMSLADMERLFDGIRWRHHDVDDDQLAGADDLRDVSGGGREAGRRLAKLSGTIQNDILKEFIAQKEYIFPPRVDALITDIFEFCAKECRAGTRSR
jgi:methylmalonyl-CoA mutase N-terminal domain/subunit